MSFRYKFMLVVLGVIFVGFGIMLGIAMFLGDKTGIDETRSDVDSNSAAVPLGPGAGQLDPS